MVPTTYQTPSRTHRQKKRAGQTSRVKKHKPPGGQGVGVPWGVKAYIGAKEKGALEVGGKWAKYRGKKIFVGGREPKWGN